MKNMKGVVSFDFDKYNVKVSAESDFISHELIEEYVGERPGEKNQLEGCLEPSCLPQRSVQESLDHETVL